MKKIISGLSVLFLLLFFVSLIPASAQVAQDSIASYDLYIEYIGPVVMYPEGKDRPVTLCLYSPVSGLVQEILMEKTDDFHFRCDLPNLQNGVYFFRVTDVARYDGKSDDSTVVGNTLLVTVKQTEKTRQLNDIRQHDSGGKAVFFELTPNGDILSNPPPILPVPKK